MRPGRSLIALLLATAGLLGLALGEVPQENSPGARPVPGEIAPTLLLGRRSVPGENDPYFLSSLTLDALRERLEKAAGSEERIRLAYSLLVWQAYSTAAIEDTETRRRLYSEAERLFLAVLAENARRPIPDPALESNVLFFIGAAWAAWKGTLDPLARERLERCSSLKGGHYRLAAELLVEKLETTPGLEAIVARIRSGDDGGALPRLDQYLEKHPSDAAARYWRGLVQYRLGRLEEAIASFSACLALDADHSEALEARGSCRWARKEWKDAAADWEAAIARSPRSRGRLQPYLEKAREAAR